MYAQEKIKPYAGKAEKGKMVKSMFDTISPTYDKLNLLGSDGIEGFVGKRHVHAVFVDKGDDLSQPLSRSLLAPYLHHAIREVGEV